jgi:hypothetical protein
MNKKLIIFTVLTSIIFLFLQCENKKNPEGGHDDDKQGHDNHESHMIISLPYNLNKAYFDKLPSWKVRKNYCSSIDSVEYVAFNIGNSRRKLFENLKDSIIYIPFMNFDTNPSIGDFNIFGDSMTLKGKERRQNVLGSQGCNFFLTTEDNSDLAANSKSKNACKLDSFMIGDQIYIHLLDIPHPGGVAPDTITLVHNYEFPISELNYNKLNQHIKSHDLVGSGYDNFYKIFLNVKINGVPDFKIRKDFDIPGIYNNQHLIPITLGN